MTKHYSWIVIVALPLTLAACQQETERQTESTTTEPPASAQDAANEAETSTEPPPRNFARLGAKRGLIEKTDMATSGYVLYNPLTSATTYLIDMDGNVVHTWDTGMGISGGMYLKDNGNLVRSSRDPEAPVFAGGGQGGWFKEYTWDGELVWEYHFASEEFLSHHDIALLPNGNILAIAWESKSVDEAITAGRNPEAIPVAGLWPDWVVELRPNGSNDADIVWEWHLWDHLVQDFDESKENFGIVADHPELMDVNLAELPEPMTQEELEQRFAMGFASTNSTVENNGADFHHANAINYNAELDQIALSLPGVDEIVVIDHSTTTTEAAGHTGGRWGKGGDLLYRWGNPANYGRGDESSQRLSGQHDVRWIPDGYPGAGNLLVYNNVVPGTKPPYSAVYELQTPLTDSGYELMNGESWGPEEPVWSYVPSDPMSLFSPFISGAQRLANGNTLVTEGAAGRFLEVDTDGNVLWEYLDPYAGNFKNPDGTRPQPVGPFVHATFRATHYAADHPAVGGRNLAPLDPQPAAYVPADE